MKKSLMLLLATFALLGFCSAHQPRVVRDQPNDENNPIVVVDPEISQAFYGTLSWKSDVYQIKMDTGFLLYVNIIVPELSGQRTDFLVDIIEWNDAVYTRLDGRRFQRTGFYEEFAGDQYLRWPEFEREVPAGTYNITVSNKDNQGKYSLAIGKIESFSFSESMTTLARLPALKMHFFEKSFFSIWEGKIIQFLSYGLIIFLVVLITIITIIKKARHSKKSAPKASKKIK